MTPHKQCLFFWRKKLKNGGFLRMANENREMAVVQASQVIGRRQKRRGKSRFAKI